MHGKPGFIWTFDSYDRCGRLIDSETQHNLLPDQGVNHWLGVLLKSVSQVPTWYIGLYSGDYIPQAGDTMSDFPVSATEISTYSGATRKPFVPGEISAGECNNFDSVAEFEFTSDVTVRGGFLASSSGKGASSGVLLSAVRFTSPKARETGEILKVRAAVGLISI